MTLINIKNLITHGQADVGDSFNVDVETIDDLDAFVRIEIVHYRSNERIVNSNISNKSVTTQSEYGSF